ncbi:MAG: hypothetical protein WCF67_11630 [Chitinophagaceae bacterium]
MPPKPSVKGVLDSNLFRLCRTYGDVDKKISGALRTAGYQDFGYYYFQGGGFAVVTSFERIRDDGSPFPEDQRWTIEKDQSRKYRLFTQSWWNNFLFSSPDYYRCFVFIISSSFQQTSGQPPGFAEVQSWENGYISLPEDLRMAPFKFSTQCAVLVYNYKQPENLTTKAFLDHNLTLNQHLNKSKIYNALNER